MGRGVGFPPLRGGPLGFAPLEPGIVVVNVAGGFKGGLLGLLRLLPLSGAAIYATTEGLEIG
jgi:hypothetical protein